jgi:hypothetical protein
MRRLSLLIVVLTGIGCGTSSGNLKLKVLDTAAQPPANVAVYFSATDKAGQPLTSLKLEDVKIYEDGKPVSEKKGKRAFLDLKMVESHTTLILVDMAGPLVDSEYLPELVKAVGQMVDRLTKAHHEVAVSVFDGTEELIPMFGFGADNPKEAVEVMAKFRPKDRNSNLNGAIFQGVAALEKQMATSSAAHKQGNLVIFTDRGDLAHKVSADVVSKALDKTPADVYFIATGENLKKEEIAPMARTDAFYSSKTSELSMGFTGLAKALEGSTAGRYLLGYCSPRRKGEHDLEVEVTTETDSGKISQHFSAKGFKKGCSPKKKPAFRAKADKGEEEGDEAGGEAAAGKDDDKGAAKDDDKDE